MLGAIENRFNAKSIFFNNQDIMNFAALLDDEISDHQ